MDGIFYTVIRLFIKNGSETHSVEIKQDRESAVQRFFNVLAADLADSGITYNACHVMDSNGLMIESRVFDRRAAEVEE